jgi:FHA domain-containing protein
VKRYVVCEVDHEPLPALDLAENVVVIGSSASARIRVPVPHGEHAYIEGDRWNALADLFIDGTRQLAGTSGPIGNGVTLELGVYRVRVEPSPVGAPASTPQRTESLARELVRGLLGANAAPSLEVVRGHGVVAAGARRELPPPEATVVIGRGDDAGWVLLDEDLSREHVEIRRGWDGVAIRDLGSKNGTRVDGEPISGHDLRDGAKIAIGNLELVFRDPAERHLRGTPLDTPAEVEPTATSAATTLPPSPWPFVIAAAIAGLAIVALAWVVMG